MDLGSTSIICDYDFYLFLNKFFSVEAKNNTYRIKTKDYLKTKRKNSLDNYIYISVCVYMYKQ